MSGPDWTPEATAQLRVLWGEGHATVEIGRRMRISKNAVVGKAHRLNLTPRPSPIRKRDPNKPITPKIQRAPRVTLPGIAGPAAGPHTNPRPERQTPAARVAPHGQHRLPIKGPTLPKLNLPETRQRGDGRIVGPTLAVERVAVVPIEIKPRGRVIPCCWPHGDPGAAGFRFCSDPSQPAKSYCAEHCELAYVKTRAADAA